MGTKNKLTAKDYEKLGRLIDQVANSGQGTTKNYYGLVLLRA